jgi:hypothetical protein
MQQAGEYNFHIARFVLNGRCHQRYGYFLSRPLFILLTNKKAAPVNRAALFLLLLA